MYIAKQKQTHRNKLVGYQWGEGKEEEEDRSMIYKTSMYKINKQQV